MILILFYGNIKEYMKKQYADKNNNNKRIIIARSNGVDPDSRVEKEANSLAKAGYNVTILAWDRFANYRKKISYKKLSDTTVERVSFGVKAEFGAGMKSLRQFLIFQIRLFGWLVIHHNEYDIAHLCDFDTAFFGSKAARLFRKKVVFDVFDYLSTDAKSFFQRTVKFLEDSTINKASATIICTEERKMQIKDAKPKKLIVIHNTPDISFYPQTSIVSKSKKTKLVYVGILQDYRLIKEMIHAVETCQDIELHIGGFGKYDEYVRHESEKYDNIIYYGKLQYDDTLKLENNCDIMTAIYDPSIGNHYYAAPNKFYEALFLGKPIIMVKETGMSSVVKENDIGVLIDYSEDGFLDGLNRLISKKNEWGEISKKMKRLYNEKYSWTEMEKRLYDLYGDL